MLIVETRRHFGRPRVQCQTPADVGDYYSSCLPPLITAPRRPVRNSELSLTLLHNYYAELAQNDVARACAVGAAAGGRNTKAVNGKLRNQFTSGQVGTTRRFRRVIYTTDAGQCGGVIAHNKIDKPLRNRTAC